MKRTLIWVLIALLATVIAILAIVLIPMLTHESTGSSGQERPTGFVSEVTAVGEDARTRYLAAFDENGDPADLANIQTGDIFTVKGSGYDSNIGIYVGFCKVPETPDGRPSPCLGGIPEDAQAEKTEDISNQALESAWVTNNWAWRTFASHTFEDAAEGTFEVTLVVPPSAGEGIDCTVDECGLFTRADHTALSDRIQDLYLPIAFAD